jgi:N-acetylmuramoyl-L-alanine amidase
MVLEGADMPAVVLEIGYISNPAEEKALRDINVLSKIAKGIHNAVDEFFQKVR